MEDCKEVLRQCPLFHSIADDNLSAMLACLNARMKSFQKGETILAEGSPAKYLGIVLSGEAQIIRMDYYGNRSIVTNIEPAQIFAESFACAGIDFMPVSVIAAEDSRVLLIDANRITRTCSSACEFHSQVIFNLLRVVATKNLLVNQKIEITSRRTTREKLMAYLMAQAKKNGSQTFTIPYDRQELADYLEVDRSGLSAEIGKLKRDGVLDCRRSTFTLK